MQEFSYTIKDPNGVHARPAGLLVKAAKGFASSVTLTVDGKSCDAKKILAVMGMAIKQGSTVTVRAEGADEEACAAAVHQTLAENL